jgi:hypothetical protein
MIYSILSSWKPTLFLLAFSLLTKTCLAQISITPVGLTDTSQSYLYIGVDNPVRISGITNEHVISISMGNATITKVDKDKFIVRVGSVTDNAIISVSKQGPGKILAKREFKVREISEPQANWISGSTVSGDSLLKNPFLSYSIPDCYFKLDFEIISYNITIDSANSILEHSTTGSRFSEAFIKHLKTNKTAGALLTFDNIRVKGWDGRLSRIPGIVLYLK